jgi:translocation and assembly module TamB
VNGTPRTLGLTELRLGLAAHGGTWQVTQALAGKQLGVLSGTQSLRTAPDAVVPAPDAAIDGRVELRIPDLAVWAPWLPPGWRIGGKLQAAASLGGRVNAPTWRGRIDGDGIEAHQLFDGIHLQDGTLAVALRGDDAAIERLEFKDGARAGTLRIDGNARFGDTPRTQLRAVASQFRVLDRVDRHVTVSGSADVSVQGPRVRARGNFEVDHGLIDVSQSEAPSLDGDIVVVNDPHGDATAQARIDSQPPGAGRPAGEQAGALAQADVEVQVDLGKALRLRGRGIDAILQGRLRASTERSRLGVFGNVRIVEGTYKAYRQNLSIERGVLSFAGDVANPRLDVLAIRPDIDTRVGVIVSGTAVAPRVRLYSEPDLPDIDKLTWLVMGRGPEGVGQADTALLQRAALALLSGDKTEDEGFLERLGIDSLSVRRAESGSTADTVLGVGKQLSRRLYVGYERALAGAGGSWQLIYRIAQLLTVRAQAGDENTVDVIWTWRWE